MNVFNFHRTERSIIVNHFREGAQWLSGRVLDSRPNGRGFEPHRRHCIVSLSKNINPSLVLVQPRKTRPFITEGLLMGRKESNQTKSNKNFREYLTKDISWYYGYFFCNNSDGRIWAFYSTYLTLDRDNPGIGLYHFVRKLLFLLNGCYF